MAWFKRNKKSIKQHTPPEERRVKKEAAEMAARLH